MRGFGKPLGRQRGMEIAPGIIQRTLETIRLGFEFEQRGMLRLITLPDTITKNPREHCYPFGDLVARILEAIPRRSC